jgi:hypothetical protein
VHRLLLAATALVVFTGCSNDNGVSVTTGDGSTSTRASTTTTAAPETTVPTPSTQANAVIEVTDQPGEGEFDGALDDVTSECTAGDGAWTASGSVTNPTDAAASYRIFVSYLDPAGETLALVQSGDDLTAVGAGESREWSAAFISDIADLRCVLRVERRPA